MERLHDRKPLGKHHRAPMAPLSIAEPRRWWVTPAWHDGSIPVHAVLLVKPRRGIQRLLPFAAAFCSLPNFRPCRPTLL